MSFANRVLLLLLQSGFLLFLLVLIAVARTSKTMLKKTENLHLCLVTGFRINAVNFFAIENNVCCGFVIYVLYYAEVYSFYTYFLESFYHKWLSNFVKSFLCVYWDDHIFLIFQLLNMVYQLIDFYILKNHCIPAIKPTWSLHRISLMCCWILFPRLSSIFSSSSLKMQVKFTHSCPTLWDPMETIQPMEFSRQGYWSG